MPLRFRSMTQYTQWLHDRGITDPLTLPPPSPKVVPPSHGPQRPLHPLTEAALAIVLVCLAYVAIVLWFAL